MLIRPNTSTRHSMRDHRYLMSRLSLQVTSCIVDSTDIYIMVVKFRNTICPPPPQLSLHTRAALSSNSSGTRSVYNRKNPRSSLYCDMSMYGIHSSFCTATDSLQRIVHIILYSVHLQSNAQFRAWMSIGN
jgi:hypothetical protein